MSTAPNLNDVEHPAVDPTLWKLASNVVFLNHGSFGSCPAEVLEKQQALRNRLERQPVQFFVRELEAELDAARSALARFLGADPSEIVFIQNATSGVNAVLRSLRFQTGDELLVTDHEYNACRNALDFVAERWGAEVVVVAIPFPLRSGEEVLARVLEKVSARTKLLLIDHVTSQTGMVLPIKRVISEVALQGIDTLVDGAHAPGMVSLALDELGAAYYTGNCHKWLCAPKGAAFLYVRPDRQSQIRPLTISHGANSPRSDRSRFQLEFDWTGTSDPSAYLSVPYSLQFMRSAVEGGWEAVRNRNRQLALAARQVICDALEIEKPCSDEMIGSLASFPIPDGESDQPPESPLYADPLQERLLDEFQIEVPVLPWPAPPKRLLRISAQLYNSLDQYRKLAFALPELIQ